MAWTNTAVGVGTATEEAVAANSGRRYLLLINDSDTVMYVKMGAAAVLNQGIRLNANGGAYEMSSAFGNLNGDAVNAIHGGSGDKVLLVVEG